MIHFYKLILILILLFELSCSNKKNNSNNIIEYDITDFTSFSSLEGEIIDFYDPLDPVFYYIVRDSLLFIKKKSASPYYIDVYNYKTKKHLWGFASKGNGPYEYLNVSLKYSSITHDYIILHDINKQIAGIYNLDSLLLIRSNYKPQIIQLPRHTTEIAILDSLYILGYNNYSLSSKQYNNKVPCLFRIEIKNQNITGIESFNYDSLYFTANVTGGQILVSPDANIIWVIHKFNNKIDIYDKNLHHINSLIGPHNIEPKYILREDGKHVSFKETYLTFLNCFTNNNEIYIIYLGAFDLPINESYIKPVHILKYSWSGELLDCYYLDRYLYNISIDSHNKYIYGTSVSKSYNEYPLLIKYELY